MATGQKISAQTSATAFNAADIIPIVQSGNNRSLAKSVMFDDPQICKAWVNFNGTGTVAIRDSYNVDSITDNGTGDYTINFDTAMSDANYNVSGNGGTSGSSVAETNVNLVLLSTSDCRIRLDNTVGTSVDRDIVTLNIFGS